MTAPNRTTWVRAVSAFAAVTLAVSACATSSATPSPAATVSATAAAESPASSMAPGESTSAAPSMSGEDLTGQTVTVIGTWGGAEQEAFLAMVKPWEEQTGATVKYTGTRDLNTVLTTGVASGVLPDLAGLPGPGQMAEWAGQPRRPLDDVLDVRDLHGRDRAAAGRARQGRRQARRRVHQDRRQGPDLVQPQDASTSAASAPATWDDLQTGDHRQQGARRRRRGAWASSPAPRPAGRAPTGSRTSSCARPVRTSTTSGGRARSSGPTRPSRRRSRPSATSSPTAYGGGTRRQRHQLRERRRPAVRQPARLPVPPPGELHHRPRRVQDRRPRAPTTTSSRSRTSTRQYAGAVEGAGDLFGMFHDTPAAKSLMAYLVTAQAQDIWVKIGGALSANKNATSYPDDISKRSAEILAEREDLRVRRLGPHADAR